MENTQLVETNNDQNPQICREILEATEDESEIIDSDIAPAMGSFPNSIYSEYRRKKEEKKPKRKRKRKRGKNGEKEIMMLYLACHK